MPMRSCVFGLALLVCCLGPVTTAMAGDLLDHAHAAPPAVRAFQGGRFSVEVHHAPWDAVLQPLERLTGIEILVRGPLIGTLTHTFEALPLEQGLRRLFR